MAETVLPQRCAALERQVESFVHAALVESVEEVIERHVQRCRVLDNRPSPGGGWVCPLDSGGEAAQLRSQVLGGSNGSKPSFGHHRIGRR